MQKSRTRVHHRGAQPCRAAATAPRSHRSLSLRDSGRAEGRTRRQLIIASLLTLVVLPLSAIDTSRPVAEKIGILKSAPERTAGIDKTIRKVLPGYLEASLKEAGFEVRSIDRTIEQMSGGTDDDILIDIGAVQAGGEPVTTVDAGASIEGVGVGGEVSVITASAFVEIRIYNAKTLERLTSLEMNGEATGAALTGIGIGDPHGWFRFRIPIPSKGPLKEAAQNIAKDVAAALREEFGTRE